MSDFKARVNVEVLDSQLKNVEDRLNAMDGRRVNINLNPQGFENIRNQINNLNNLQRVARTAGANTGQQFVDAFQSSIGTINTKNAANTIQRLQRTLAGFKLDRAQINMVTQQIDNMNLAIQKIETNIARNGNIAIRITGIDEIGRVVSQTREFDRASNTLISSGKRIVQTFQNIRNATTEQLETANNNFITWINNNERDLDSYADRIENLRTRMTEMRTNGASEDVFRQWADDLKVLQSELKSMQSTPLPIDEVKISRASTALKELEVNFSKLGSKGASFSKELSSLSDELRNFDRAAEPKDQAAKYDEILERIENLRLGYRQLTAETNKANQGMSLNTNKSILSNQIETWLNRNTKAAKAFSVQIQQLKAQLNQVSSSSELENIRRQFQEIRTSASAQGLTGKGIFGTLWNNITKLSPLFGMGALINKSIQSLKNMYNNVIELDSALVDLQKTTTASLSELNDYYYEANEIAKEYGATTREIIQSTADWSRLGFNLADSKTMSKLSSQFASISPGVDVDEATSGLVSIMKAYGLEANEALDGIMSKINIVGNSFGVSNADVLAGLKRSSAAMSAMGQDLDSTIALFTAMNEILQDASSAGTILRSMSLRMRGFDEETEQLSDDLVDINGKIINYTKTAKNAQGVSIFTDASQTHYKDFVQYFKELSQIWDDMSEKNRQSLLNDLFGKRGAQGGAAIIKNFETVESALEKMTNSAGNADKEMGVIKSSLEYKINALGETFVGISQNLFRRDDVGVLIEALTGLLELIDKLTEHLGLFGTVAAGAGITAFIKNFG